MCGTMIPWTPRSKNRRMVDSSWLGIRVMGVILKDSAARTMCSTWSRFMGPCSQSIITKSNPMVPKISTISGEKRLTIAPKATLPSASLVLVVLVRIVGMVPSWIDDGLLYINGVAVRIKRRLAAAWPPPTCFDASLCLVGISPIWAQTVDNFRPCML